MDFVVSRKEKRWQPRIDDTTGQPVMVLVDSVFDIYPIYGNELDPNIITDVEIYDDDRAELLDRSMFAIVKQRGLDPVELEDGIQWAEYVLGEVPAPLVLLQVQEAVLAEGPGVRFTPTITPHGTSFQVALTNPPEGRIL